jgi:parvulin-like peptidyl-prolyl isomerase
MMRLLRLPTVLAFLLLAAMPAFAQPVAPSTVVASRGDMKLTAADVRALVARADPAVRELLQSNPAALAEFVRDRLLKQTLLADAKAANTEQSPEVQARIADARDAAIVAAFVGSVTKGDPGYPSQDQVAAAYEGNKGRFNLPKQYHVLQIALRVPTDASKEAQDKAAAKIQDIRAQTLKPKADFAELARTQSQEPISAANGGDLGWVREDALIAAVRDAISGLKDGGTSEPVRTADGWHLLKLVGTRPAGVAPLADVRDNIIQAMRQQRAQQAARSYVDAMLAKQPITLNEADLLRTVRP